jgi:hypothetical protein
MQANVIPHANYGGVVPYASQSDAADKLFVPSPQGNPSFAPRIVPGMCPVCGFMGPSDAEFCMRCGRPVRGNIPSQRTPAQKRAGIAGSFAILLGILTLVTPLISISEGILGISFTLDVSIWGTISLGDYSMDLTNSVLTNQYPALTALPLCGVIVILGVIFVGISAVSSSQQVKRAKVLDYVGGILIILGPLIFFAIFLSWISAVAGGLGLSTSFSSIPLDAIGMGTYTGIAGGIIGIIAGAINQKTH